MKKNMMNDESFNFKKVSHIIEPITKESILDKVSEIILWRFYLGVDFKLGVPINAPYRNDRNPSFNVYVNNNGDLRGKDFGTDFQGTIFDYIQMVYNCTYQESLLIIDNDFDLGFNINRASNNTGVDKINLQTTSIRKKISSKEISKLNDFLIKNKFTSLQIIPKHFTLRELNYFKEFGISYETLKLYNVYSVSKVFLNKRLYYNYEVNKELSFCYYFKRSGNMKIYFPERSTNRFLSNVNNYQDIQGYDQCKVKQRENKLLILTKSMKDVMFLRELNYDSMAIHGENHHFNEDFIRHIKKYYPRIVSLYDRDSSGMKGARNLFKKYKIPFKFINKEYKSKDISDLYYNHGLETCNQFLNNINI